MSEAPRNDHARHLFYVSGPAQWWGLESEGGVKPKLTVGSLFAGIGGFDLGFERAGMEVKWQVEIDPFCRAVLAKHWPHVRRYEDVRTVGCELVRVDVLCGGFPCQDISLAGKGAGIVGERSGLWSQFARLVGELRPSYVVVENVAALLGRGMATVLGDLAARGYDAEWDCLPARAFGARHQRDRVWIVAYPNSWRQQERSERHGESQAYTADWHSRRIHAHGLRHAMADAGSERLEGPVQTRDCEPPRGRIFSGGEASRASLQSRAEQWLVEPDVGRVAHGVPNRVDRLKGLGNAIVPQIAEWIGRRILEAEAQVTA